MTMACGGGPTHGFLQGVHENGLKGSLMRRGKKTFGAYKDSPVSIIRRDQHRTLLCRDMLHNGIVAALMSQAPAPILVIASVAIVHPGSEHGEHQRRRIESVRVIDSRDAGGDEGAARFDPGQQFLVQSFREIRGHTGESARRIRQGPPARWQ